MHDCHSVVYRPSELFKLSIEVDHSHSHLHEAIILFCLTNTSEFYCVSLCGNAPFQLKKVRISSDVNFDVFGFL